MCFPRLRNGVQLFSTTRTGVVTGGYLQKKIVKTGLLLDKYARKKPDHVWLPFVCSLARRGSAPMGLRGICRYGQITGIF